MSSLAIWNLLTLREKIFKTLYPLPLSLSLSLSLSLLCLVQTDFFINLIFSRGVQEIRMLSSEKVRGCVRSSGLTLATMAGVVGGVIFGLSLRTRTEIWTDRYQKDMYVCGHFLSFYLSLSLENFFHQKFL